MLEIENDSSQAIELYWVDYKGVEVEYKKIAPNTTYTQQTYFSHVWHFRDQQGNLILEYVATRADSQKIVFAANNTISTPTP